MMHYARSEQNALPVNDNVLKMPSVLVELLLIADHSMMQPYIRNIDGRYVPYCRTGTFFKDSVATHVRIHIEAVQDEPRRDAHQPPTFSTDQHRFIFDYHDNHTGVYPLTSAQFVHDS